MTALAKIYQKISKIGIQGTLPTKEKGRIQLINVFSLVSICLLVIYIPTYIIFDTIDLVWLSLIQGMAYCLSLLCNYLHRYITSKLIFILQLNLATIGFASVLGEYVNLQLLFIPLLGLSIVFFEPEDSFGRWWAIIVTTISFFLIESFDYHLLNSYDINPNFQRFMRWTIIVVVLFLNYLILNFFSTYARKAEDEVKILLEETKNFNQQLSIKNQQLESALTQLKEAQQQLIESEKMASLGQLTAGIAHEINNPINFITANIESLNLDFQDLQTIVKIYQAANSEAALKKAHAEVVSLDSPFLFEEVEGLIKGISEGANRTQEIVTGLRTFSRMDENSFKHVDIHDGIDSTLTLLKNNFKQNIKINKNYGELSKVECLPGKMNQVFMNVLTNAIQAIDEQGEITITTRQISPDKISISFKDTGGGMDEAVRNRIFEPFFTTKPVGQGTGLGLAISYGIIDKHNGCLEVHSQLAQGSEFIISLPIQQP